MVLKKNNIILLLTKSTMSQLKRDPDAEDASGMSASKLRPTVIDNNFESFKKGV